MTAVLEKTERVGTGRGTVQSPLEDVGTGYAWYVLFVLLLVAVLNYVDRRILEVLAEDIKVDLGLSDADMGFLLGAAFAVFYATFGIALGRLADVWNRKKLISLGLGVWSIMTALSGLAKGFVPLAACRFGVGAGEASCLPASYSMLYDYFPPKVRTTVVAIFNIGIIAGGGLGIFLGGVILEFWSSAWPDNSLAPFGLKGWQAALIIVGLPGFLIALLVATLKEPVRGQADDHAEEAKVSANTASVKEAWVSLLSVLPIGNLWVLGGRKPIQRNLLIASFLSLIVYGLISVTGSKMQWLALGFGTYAAISWVQVLAHRDPVVFGIIFGCRTMRFLIVAAALGVFDAAAAAWTIPFFLRYHGVSPQEIASVVGVGTMAVGVVGVFMGGWIADKLRKRTSRGKLYVAVFGTSCALLCKLIMLTTGIVNVAYAMLLLATMVGSATTGPMVSTVNDLVLPRARATAYSFYTLTLTLVGFALAPYVVGHFSDQLTVSGLSSGEALRQSMLWVSFVLVGTITFMFMASRSVEEDEATIYSRARALGENI